MVVADFSPDGGCTWLCPSPKSPAFQISLSEAETVPRIHRCFFLTLGGGALKLKVS